MLVIYTADVRKGSTKPVLRAGAVTLEIIETFLSELDFENILENEKKSIETGSRLSSEEKLRLMICPLAVKGKPGKIAAIHKVIELAKAMPEAEEQQKVLAGMLAFCDKMISDEDVEEIRSMIKMTKFERLIHEEQMEKIEQIALNLLADGMECEAVSRNTGLDIKVVKELAEKVAKEKDEASVLV